MATTNLNIRIDSELRSEATQVFKSYGLSPTQAIKLFFNQVVATKEVPLSFNYQSNNHTLSPQGEKLLQESVKAFENGEYTSYASLDELNQAMELHRLNTHSELF